MIPDTDAPDEYQMDSPTTDTDDLDAHERTLRDASGYGSPRAAVRASRTGAGPPRSCAVLRHAAPVHRREPPDGCALAGPVADHPLPRGTVIAGPVTNRRQADEYLTDGVGWLVHVGPDGTTEPVPVVTGRYYDGTPRLAIIAELLVPPPETPLDDAARRGP